MNRKTRLFRNGPSNKQRDKLLQQVSRHASALDAIVITLVKSFGSSLKEGEASLTIPANEPNLARPFERLHIAEGPNKEILLRVDIDPDVAEQMAAFNAEMTATDSKPVIPVMEETIGYSDPTESEV